MENVLRVARELYHGVAGDVLVLAPQVEVVEADVALLAVRLQVQVVLHYLLLQFEPQLAAEGHQPLPRLSFVRLVPVAFKRSKSSVVDLYAVD